MSLDEIFQKFLLRLADSGPVYILLVVFFWKAGPTLKEWGDKGLTYWMEIGRNRASVLEKVLNGQERILNGQAEHLLSDERRHRESVDKQIEVGQFNRHEAAKMSQLVMDSIRESIDQRADEILDRVDRVSELAVERLRRHMRTGGDTLDVPKTGEDADEE